MAHQNQNNQPCDCPICTMLEELGQPDFVEEDANGFVWTAHRLDDGSGRMMLSMFPPGQIKIIDEVGRNQPCPCGSGRKYKKCCGRTN